MRRNGERFFGILNLEGTKTGRPTLNVLRLLGGKMKIVEKEVPQWKSLRRKLLEYLGLVLRR